MGRKLSIAICGIRGIPACYGGFETLAEQLAPRLAERGHRVRVYGRKPLITYQGSTYRGVEIKLITAPRHKYFETPIHTLRCLLDLVRNPVDVVLVCNAANSVMLWLPRLAGMPVAVNVDGIERQRAKWNWLGKAWCFLGERASLWFGSAVVSDAQVIADYYAQRYGWSTRVIPYGYDDALDDFVQRKLAAKDHSAAFVDEREFFAEHAIEPGRYLLYVSRLEPENNAHLVVAAYNSLPATLKTMPLVVVGDAPYAREYIAALKQSAGDNIVFAGFQFGRRYQLLQLGAYFYIQATEVGGTHPALVEAIGFGNCVLANSTPENREVLAQAGFYYRRNEPADLTRLMQQQLQSPQTTQDARCAAYARAADNYSWRGVADRYEDLLEELVGGCQAPAM